ncbi:phage holin family protein [Paenibacillus thiaminolyticus]|uniref:phage holin family protein n=1 Tax=Paenibacillus thiaminolyticus TaxID=49283 RepID=UPI002542960C|nr:phage holin family protein [Paenibacillus thiaminolyticus]WII39708.1 phage holin family protein [Paenibacillus thiaminolyticus]
MEKLIMALSQIIGDYAPKQLAAGGAVGLFGVLVTLYGGWPSLLNVLLILVAFDYVTGVMAAGAEGKLKSSIGLLGVARKVFIFVVVAVAHQVDTVLGDQHMLRDATIFFYLANELLSIIENGGRLGVPLPAIIKKAVEVLKAKGGEQDDHRN